MLKDLKLGVKMTIGFGLVILLVVAIGGLAVYNMLHIQRQSVSLQEEYLPEVEITTEVERNALLTMYDMRGYALTYDNEYFRDGSAYLDRVDEALESALALSQQFTELTALRSNVNTAMDNVDEYSRLAEQTRTAIQEVQRLRAGADEAAAVFMKNCSDYLASQNVALEREVRAETSEARLLERIRKINLINEVIDAGNEVRVSNFKGQLLDDHQSMKNAVIEFSGLREIMKELLAITRQDVNIRQINAITDSGDEYVQVMEAIVAQFAKLDEIKIQREEAGRNVLESAQTTSKAGIKNTEEVADNAVQTVAMSVKLILVGLVVATVVAVIIAVFLTMMIVRALQKGVVFAQEIALGDLDAKLDVYQKDEAGILADALREMQKSLQYKAEKIKQIANKNLAIDIEKASEKDGLGESLIIMKNELNKLLGEVNSAVEQVNSGADQVSQASQSLSQGAAEQASSLEEITSSTNQINSQSKQNAESATEAHAIARQANEDAQSGNTQMRQLSEIMERIDASSDEINKVVKVIDDIAFQINLLALNANVEAARAGKYGKGFAVVADEVRNLAVKSADSVKETTRMVEETVMNIRQGTDAAETTAKQLDSIVDGSAKVANFLEEIAQASREQAQAIEQITEGLDQIDAATQSSTASAEESASASEELASQAQQLRGMVAQFQIENGHGAIGTAVSQFRAKAAQPARSTVKSDWQQVKPEEQIRLDDDDFDRF